MVETIKITVVYQAGVEDTYPILRENVGEIVVHFLENSEVIAIHLFREVEG